MSVSHEPARWLCTWHVARYSEIQHNYAARLTGRKPTGKIFRDLGIMPQSEQTINGNMLVTDGLNRLTSRLISADQVWDNDHTGLAVGNSDTAAALGQSDLQGASAYYNTMDASYPQQSDGVLTFESTFGTGDANFAWEEWAVIIPDTGTSLSAGSSLQTDYEILNRKVASLGTKGSGATWVFTATVTISNP